MRLHALILFFGVLTTISGDPDPKKYKSEIKDKKSNTTLTFDENKFLRDVEAKFGIKNDSPKEKKKDDIIAHGKIPLPGRFPAVIAIEIVNDTDTDTKTKGKRTIDANLGYGYRTSNGYTYSYFGKPSQEQGKFMVYPYSQEDIPAGNVHSHETVHHHEKPYGNHIKTSVEITPSQAFELVSVKGENSKEAPGYHYKKPSIDFKTPSSSHGPGPTSYYSHPSTLYTTYNGEKFTDLSGQFPTVMPNYLVDPSQLLRDPEYQNVGLSQDQLQSSNIEQKVVPVLVLRIPSSSLTNPTAELYANLPHNYLNNLNLQELVNDYFKKIGYNTGPRVMSYSSSLSSATEEGSSGSPVSHYESQHYSHSHGQPSYTHSHSAGVQYSAVQPVMAKYPSSYTENDYSGQTHNNQDSMPQKYEYKFVPQPDVSSQNSYVSSSHYQQQAEHVPTHGSYESLQNAGNHDHSTHGQYEGLGHTTSYETSVNHDTGYVSLKGHLGAEYTASHVGAEYAEPQAHFEYGTTNDENSHSLPSGYQSSGLHGPSSYESTQYSNGTPQEYYSQHIQEAQQGHSVYPSQDAQSQLTQAELSGYQNYIYEHKNQESDDHGLILSENYPSKDHTIATILPNHYPNNAVKQNSEVVQTVSYVTPTPHGKYKIPYQVMVPQTYIHNPTTEKVAYVNSESISGTYNPEAELHTLGHQFKSQGSKQRPTYSSNYHSHPKRMVHKHSKPRRMVSKTKRSRYHKKRLS